MDRDYSLYCIYRDSSLSPFLFFLSNTNQTMDGSGSHTSKWIQYDPTGGRKAKGSSTTKIPTPKPKTKRVVTATEKWNFRQDDFDDVFQRRIADRMFRELSGGDEAAAAGADDDALPSSKIELARQQIRAKMSGYRAQDQLKGIYLESDFVTFERIVELMHACNLTCFYCKEGVKMVYEYVREPKQWSLERMDNAYGHNGDNVVIACLTCNLRRRTMHYERYVATKQMQRVHKV